MGSCTVTVITSVAVAYAGLTIFDFVGRTIDEHILRASLVSVAATVLVGSLAHLRRSLA